LIEGLSLLHAARNCSSCVFHHFDEFAYIVQIRNGPVARDDFYIWRQPGNDLFESSNPSEDVASGIQIDKGKPNPKEIVAHVYDIRFREVHDAVTIGVTIANVNDVNVLTIHVKGDFMLEGDHREFIRRQWLYWKFD